MRHLNDVVCFSHLRYEFVFQRPNHLMSRCARDRRVFYVEEAQPCDGEPELEISQLDERLWKIVPHVPAAWGPDDIERTVPGVLEKLLHSRGVAAPVLWFYTPMALPLARSLSPALVVYDCMDELSGFLGANPLLAQRERALFDVADLVFTGGHSLYRAKKRHHSAVHAFPSSVDVEHFSAAREALDDPPDQAGLPSPRAGFYGVIDERIDLELLAAVADQRPEVQFMMVGPVVKIDPLSLPRRSNIHYLGMKRYEELPAYLAGWDVAIMPFALNRSTEFISPTKTLEYLAAHKPVVSTAIADVVSPYGEIGAVRIASSDAFAQAIDDATRIDRRALAALANSILSKTSWDATWGAMSSLMMEAAARREGAAVKEPRSYRCSTI